MDISIIIPTYNEEKSLKATLDCITKYMPEKYLYEIIIVDNCSQDNTVEVAKYFNAKIIENQPGTISALRNTGAKKSSGKILIFLDADVLLTQKWEDNFTAAYNHISHNPEIISGSWYGISKKGSWIENNWFAPLCDKPITHMNSGHLIITRKFFDELGGFNESLETGEDYEFSMRAIKNGGEIINNQGLFVHHEGYPKTLMGFIKREIWHGKGDFHSFQSFILSKVAIISITIVLLNLLFIIFIILGFNYLIIITVLLLIIIICFTAACVKYFPARLSTLMVNTLLYYIYFNSRFFSLIQKIFIDPAKRK